MGKPNLGARIVNGVRCMERSYGCEVVQKDHPLYRHVFGSHWALRDALDRLGQS